MGSGNTLACKKLFWMVKVVDQILFKPAKLAKEKSYGQQPSKEKEKAL